MAGHGWRGSGSGLKALTRCDEVLVMTHKSLGGIRRR